MLYYWIPTWFESLTLQGVQISYVLSCWFTAVWGLGGCLGGSSIIGGEGVSSRRGGRRVCRRSSILKRGFQYNRGRIYFESGGNADLL